MWFTTVALNNGLFIFLNAGFAFRFFSDGTPTVVEEAHHYLATSSIWGYRYRSWKSSKGVWWGYEISQDKIAEVQEVMKNFLGNPIEQIFAVYAEE